MTGRRRDQVGLEEGGVRCDWRKEGSGVMGGRRGQV